MVSASAPASVQLPAPASSLAVPPPPASTVEAVDLSARAAILEDPGPAAGGAVAASTRAGFLPDSRRLLIYIYRRLCSGFDINTSILEVVTLHLASFSLCVCHIHRFFIFSSLPSILCSSCIFAFWSYFAGILCVRTRSYMGSDTAAMYEILFLLL